MRTVLNTHSIPQPTTRGLLLRKNQGKLRKGIQATITLTSLIDAFVIIVLYLVVCNSPSETIDLEDQIVLPQAKLSNQLDGSPVVTFKNNQFMIDGSVIRESELSQYLSKLAGSLKLKVANKEPAVILQADEKVDFNKLQPFLTASAHAGIKNVKFAVYQQE
ncbi:biopolymer transporter ExbD [bacterium]|nr:biopolymer transporter ExbD [bacterium]